MRLLHIHLNYMTRRGIQSDLSRETHLENTCCDVSMRWVLHLRSCSQLAYCLFNTTTPHHKHVQDTGKRSECQLGHDLASMGGSQPD